MRRAISLLEVLIAMFVLAVGLLALASLVPVGQFQVQQATNADSATTLGRNFAFRQIKVLDLMDSDSWVYLTAGLNYLPAWEDFDDADNDGVYDSGETFTDLNGNGTRDTPAPFMTSKSPFIIDGLGIASNFAANNAAYRYFPAGGAATFPGSGVPRLDRLSIRNMSLPGNNYIDLHTADRIFRGMDDRDWLLPTDETQRPQHLVDSSSNPLPMQAQSRGNYSWLVMIEPALWWDTTPVRQNPSQPSVPRFTDGLGTTTVVVFHKRDITDSGTPPGERALWADVLNAGGGSLDVQLRDTASSTLTSAKEVTKVRPNHWVMISGQIAAVQKAATFDGAGNELTPPVNTPAIPVHQWFRVVTAGEAELLDPEQAWDATNNPYILDVTLAGPDLNYYLGSASRFADADSNGAAAAGGDFTLVCTICDGAVGVFQKTVQLDKPSLWTAH